MILKDVATYDGKLLHSRFAYRIFGPDKILPIGNIVAFRAPMDVGIEGMIDIQDIIAHDFIFSDDAINFCWEIPNISDYAGVCFQRLFCTQIGSLLGEYVQAPVEIRGDDIFVQKEFTQGGVTQLSGKASVSISCTQGQSVLGHLGINIQAGQKAPAFAYSTGLSDEQVSQFMVEGNNIFYKMAKEIWIATCKTI